MEATSTKTCRICGEDKPLESFSRQRGRRDGRTSYCKPCDNERKKAWNRANPDRDSNRNREYHRNWRRENPDRVRAYDRRQSLKSKYGMTPEDFESMLADQDGVCAICLGENKGKCLVVDHCHESGRVRGLLCNACNLAVGHFNDDPRSMRSAAEYIERGRQT